MHYRHYPTIYTIYTRPIGQKYIYPSVSKVQAGCFRVSITQRNFDMGLRAYLIIFMSASTASRHIFYSEKTNVFLVLPTRGSNLESSDLGSDALPREPPYQGPLFGDYT